jgi:hypothetical protein
MNMLGLTDPGVVLAYALCLLSALVCIVYGLANWNKGGPVEPPPTPDDIKWVEEEEKIEETLA